jgi:antitoxin component of MazEF toxin-antitoxin module
VKVTVRKVGNSLGVLIPKAIVDAWGVGLNDTLEIDREGIRPLRGGPVGQDRLDKLKRDIAAEVLAQFPVDVIRRKSLHNLARWKKSGNWSRTYDAWTAILHDPDDGRLYKAMLGGDDESNRLRQSMPFVGLLGDEDLGRLREKAAG